MKQPNWLSAFSIYASRPTAVVQLLSPKKTFFFFSSDSNCRHVLTQRHKKLKTHIFSLHLSTTNTWIGSRKKPASSCVIENFSLFSLSSDRKAFAALKPSFSMCCYFNEKRASCISDKRSVVANENLTCSRRLITDVSVRASHSTAQFFNHSHQLKVLAITYLWTSPAPMTKWVTRTMGWCPKRLVIHGRISEPVITNIKSLNIWLLNSEFWAVCQMTTVKWDLWLQLWIWHMLDAVWSNRSNYKFSLRFPHDLGLISSSKPVVIT